MQVKVFHFELARTDMAETIEKKVNEWIASNGVDITDIRQSYSGYSFVITLWYVKKSS